MSIDLLSEAEGGPNALQIAGLVRVLKKMERDNLSARVAGKPPSCRCGQAFTSFRARKEHLRACGGKSKAVAP